MADGLSRRPTDGVDTTQIEDQTPIAVIDGILELGGEIVLQLSHFQTTPYVIEEIKDLLEGQQTQLLSRNVYNNRH